MDYSINCLICNKLFKCPKDNKRSTYTVQVLSTIFKTLIKTTGVETGDVNFDFKIDPFPFCKYCRNQVAKLCQLSQDLDKINKRINKAVANITSTLVESSVTESSSSHNVVPTSSKNLSKANVDRKISHFRNNIKQRFSPDVRLNRGNFTTSKTHHLEAIDQKPVMLNIMQFFDDDDPMDFNDTEVSPVNFCEPYVNVNVPQKITEVEVVSSMQVTVDNSNMNLNESIPNQILIGEVSTSETMMKREMLQKPMRSMTKLPNGNLMYGGFEVLAFPDGTAKCLTCGLEFTKKRKRKYMMEHLRIVHVKESGRFQCHICGKQFNTKPHLKQHERTHLEVRAFQCSICSHTYKTAVERNRHMKRHPEYHAMIAAAPIQFNLPG